MSFVRLYIVLACLLTALFAYGQYQGIGLFDDTGDARGSGTGRGGARIFHK